MVEYDIKKGCFKNIEGDALKMMMQNVFGNVDREGDVLISSYGVMRSIRVKVLSKTQMDLTTESSSTFTDEEVLNSKRKLNEFLEQATSFNAKQRMKRAQAKAKEGSL